jgi:hypothetical protein
MGKRTRPFDERQEGKRQRPGNTPVEQQERDAAQVDKARPHDRAISGPGAADFLTAQGGEDRPGFSPTKGMADTRGESALTDPKKLVPRLGPDSEAHPGERHPDENQPGSATGTIGGGGTEAHNSSAVRATGVDDPTAGKK